MRIIHSTAAVFFSSRLLGVLEESQSVSSRSSPFPNLQHPDLLRSKAISTRSPPSATTDGHRRGREDVIRVVGDYGAGILDEDVLASSSWRSIHAAELAEVRYRVRMIGSWKEKRMKAQETMTDGDDVQPPVTNTSLLSSDVLHPGSLSSRRSIVPIASILLVRPSQRLSLPLPHYLYLPRFVHLMSSPPIPSYRLKPDTKRPPFATLSSLSPLETAKWIRTSDLHRARMPVQL
ncbi:hypothetical protein SCHPADRAFT_946056 [Schizopora paradoxa]|uniref:Uncharacterized protein n=1 Tax=Schizopora paradoxa TaxID=27342 RepID=A0A0H2R3U3_9AGAM|nr:hypothetical protein SCHPADRAFT_946056 [Schizopora paradoxa]